MKVFKTGEIMPDALEMQKDMQPYEDFTREAFNRLNFIIGFVEEQKPKIKDKFIGNLITQYKKLVKEDFVKMKKIDLKEILPNFKQLQKQPELAQLSLNFYLQNLQLADNVDWKKDKAKVVSKNLLHSFLLPRYYNLSTLIETLDREEGIKLYKRYITHYLIERRKTRKNNFESIEELFEARKEPRPPSEWSVLYGLINEGKYFYRNNNCTWVDALQDYPDNELKYLICCYGDYEGVKQHNENFILTMEHTIAEDDSYCSRVIHDTRVDYDLRHPPKEFWDNLKADED
ncbi:MAG: hypothetical protein FK730_06360 [Asgard group archaeon]|nr:hypothetical protein [Asgard group archaeon]